MKVKELIEQLEQYENKEAGVFVYYEGEVMDIELVDLDISDKVDINIKPTRELIRLPIRYTEKGDYRVLDYDSMEYDFHDKINELYMSGDYVDSVE